MLKSVGMAYVDAFVGSFSKDSNDSKDRLAYYYIAILNFAFSFNSSHEIVIQEINEVRELLENLGIVNYKEYSGKLINHIKTQFKKNKAKSELFIGAQKYLDNAEKLAASRKESKMGIVHLLEVMAKDNVAWMWPSYLGLENKVNKVDPIQTPKIKSLFLDFYDEDKKCNKQVQIHANATELKIGRSINCELQLGENHTKISANHAKITCYDGNYYIEDLNSTNGTYVNGILIGNKKGNKKYIQLCQEDIVSLGNEIYISVSILDAENIHKKTCALCNREFSFNEDVDLCPMCFYEFKKDLMQASDIREVNQIPHDFNNISLKINSINVETYHKEKLVLNIKNNNVQAKKDIVNPQPKKEIVQPGDIIPGYELIKVIGEGGMGKVYLVKERSTGKHMALKTIKSDQGISADAKERFEREAFIQQQMNHKYIAKHYSHGQYNGMLYILMEYYKHGTILDYMNEIKKTGKPYDRLKELLIQILYGLDYLHHASLKAKLASGEYVHVDGIVHRDIKPQNIFIDYDSKGNVMIKIADFGLSKAFEIAGESGMSKTGYAMGTFPFMPRQQILDTKYAKPEVDIWAAVAIIYFLGTGHFPKPINANDDIVLTCLEEKSVPIKQRNWLFPSKFAKIIDRALDDDCDKLYYQEASDLISDLLKL